MDSVNIKELNDRIQQESAFVDMLTLEMGKVIIGQKQLVENLFIGLLADGHILLEGVPGLAKTLAISTLSQAIDAKFSRIQFTPDLLPADVTGTLIYSQKDGDFEVHKGPIFANFVLADEINRAPAKVQSALRGHAGASGDHRRRNLEAAGTLLGDGYSESDRAGRNLSASGRRSTASC